MDDKKILLAMLKVLVIDIQNIQQKGAGYYSAAPFVEKYNRVLEKVVKIFEGQSDLLDTFSKIEDTKSVDPADKMKTTQRVLIEVGQLIAFLEASMKEKK